MEEGNLIGFWMIAMCIFFFLPILGIIIILVLLRKFHERSLAFGIILSGATVGTQNVISGFIGHYALTQGSPELGSILWGTIWSFYTGFGSGSVTASCLGIPFSILMAKIRSRNQIPAVHNSGNANI